MDEHHGYLGLTKESTDTQNPMTPAQVAHARADAEKYGRLDVVALYDAAAELRDHVLVPSLNTGKQYAVNWLLRRAAILRNEATPVWPGQADGFADAPRFQMGPSGKAEFFNNTSDCVWGVPGPEDGPDDPTEDQRL